MRVAKLLLAAAALLVAAGSWAQSYPNRPVRIIVPFAPGGATDIVTRVVAQPLTEMWGQSIVVDNRGGAGGNIGADLAAKATPDGYTLFMPSGSVMTANQHMYKKLGYDPEKDFVPITNVASGPQVVAVANAVAAKTIKDLIALAKSKPGAVTIGSAGIGTQTHLAAENFLYTARIDATHVPYKGEGPALTDLVGGQIQVLTPNLAASIGFINQGRIRALGVTSRQRTPQLPNVPTVAETLPGFENLGWFGLVAPAGTPKAILDKIYADLVKVLQSADIKRRFDELGMVPVGNTPAAFGKAMKEESARWAVIIRERKLAIN
ncbi:MAG: tripartite tricarboxylate transporter substrate binding protein [Betaproteobacteria bacterium]|nr:tripartite tricarboxylate transporter substrate binding protein [Betaproteobacteria bacterium]